MEALCSPRSTESLESIIICLQALYTLLDSLQTRQFLMTDRTISIELCNVLHRLLLTRDNHDSHLLCMEILKQVMIAAKEQYEELRVQKSADNVSEEDLDLLGEGGESEDIVPGESLVFAVLEVCLCLLIRHIPALSPAPNSTIIVSLKVTQPPEVSGSLIASALTTLENLCSLCSPQSINFTDNKYQHVDSYQYF